MTACCRSCCPAAPAGPAAAAMGSAVRVVLWGPCKWLGLV